ncbi:MAG: alkaline phosphatase family protein [Bacteroidetes bacterium]|nr:alkaline phosphatase family protein [Bacteroidota bacterium]MBK8342333.1 alkaline phosphatase family protein [Bacteroidota bacterium]
MGKRIAKKVLLIGWDAADWKVISPLMDAGHMPTLEKLVNGGVMGNFATLDPPLSPTLWTSISTGKRPYKHGIIGFTEPDPSGKGIRPAYITSRKVKAIWNIFNQHDMKSHVVGWWPSHPAEPINGTMISNLYQRATKPMNEPWPMLDGTVHPAEKADFYKKLRIHPGELTAAHIMPFIPDAAKIDQEKDKRLGMLTKVIADCSTIHAAATYILENEEWDFVGVYYDAIDHFCHGFMKFHPPQMPMVPDDLFNLYKDVVISGYKYHDMMLERLLQLAGPDVTVMLISDHGFHPDHLRPIELPKEPAAPALEHSPYGIFVLNGPGIKKDERIYGASILDVTPTILTMFGLPIGADMDGNVLVNAFEESIIPDKIDSWDDIPGNSGEHPKDKQEDPYAAAEAMEQLIELGYIERPSENIEKAIKSTVNENNYYLARSYMNGRKYNEAIEILTKLFEENPSTTRYGMRLAHAYQSINKVAETRDVLSKLKDVQQGRESISMKIMEGNLLLIENRPKDAMTLFEQIEKDMPSVARVNMQLGRCYLALKKWKKAETAFLNELEHDPGNSAAHHGLGVTHLRRKNFEEAVDCFLNAVGLTYFFPFAHYHLGEALYYMQEYERSAEAFEVCLKMAPGINKARQMLTTIYNDHLKKPEIAEDHKAKIQEYFKGDIVIVSGLPRSGTSMMMQMMDKGGLDIFTDGIRQPDENNPKGYYEHELVKSLARNKNWVKDAMGKCVKVISQLLFELPANYKYKIIFMERDLDEVIQSQHKMLVRDGKAKEDALNIRVLNVFKQNLERIHTWVPAQQNMEILFVSHRNLVNDPMSELQKVNAFLGNTLNIEEMAKVVDKSLHREKSAK